MPEAVLGSGRVAAKGVEGRPHLRHRVPGACSLESSIIKAVRLLVNRSTGSVTQTHLNNEK